MFLRSFDIFSLYKNRGMGAEIGHRDGINIPEGPANQEGIFKGAL